jgi:hypothetical protein
MLDKKGKRFERILFGKLVERLERKIDLRQNQIADLHGTPSGKLPFQKVARLSTLPHRLAHQEAQHDGAIQAGLSGNH